MAQRLVRLRLTPMSGSHPEIFGKFRGGFCAISFGQWPFCACELRRLGILAGVLGVRFWVG